eukprot:jgi/Psemu1/40969/gm1.40969_g
MSNIPIAGRTQSKLSGFQTLQPGSAATRSLLTSPNVVNMAPDQQDDPGRDNKDNLLRELFPSFDRALGTILRDTFDVPKESNNTLCEHVQLNLQRFINFGRHLIRKGLDWEDHNKESAADRLVGNIGTDGTGRPTKSFDQLRYESWIRKSRDETAFPLLQNDARFEHWLVKFKAELETTDINTTTFLDPNWPDIPLSGYLKTLHTKQCAFLWTLILHVFQSDLSSSCGVLSHTSTRDGRQAFFDFVKLHNRSKSKDTKVKSVTQWFAQLEHLNKLRPPHRPYARLVSDPPEAQDLIRFGQHEATATSELKTALLLEATRLDSQASLSQPSSRASVKAHAHDLSSLTQTTYSAMMDDVDSYSLPIDFDGDFQDYAVYKAGTSLEVNAMRTRRKCTRIYRASARIINH